MSKSACCTPIVPKETMKKMGITKKKIVPKVAVLGEHSIHFDYEGDFGMEVVRESYSDGGWNNFMTFNYSSQSSENEIRITNFQAEDLRKMAEALLTAALEMEKNK